MSTKNGDSHRAGGPEPRRRAILHVDMDAFYAAVEVIDDPSLRGKPVIVGGTPEGRGVVSTASYEARRFGIKSAMPAAQAVRLCPHGVFLVPRMERYAAVSRQVFAIFRDATPLVQPLSIDEAFLDVTGCVPRGVRASTVAPGDLDAAAAIARQIQTRVEHATGGLTCSIGVAENKFLAKVASDLRKPRGLVQVPRGAAADFLADLPVERLWGVGPKTAAMLRELGMDAIGKIARLPGADVERICGVELGRHLHSIANGIDGREVVTDWEARSVSQETTFARFIPSGDRDAIERVLFELAEGVAIRLRHDGVWGRTVKLKARDENFQTVTRARTLGAPTQHVEDIHPAAVDLFRTRVKFGPRAVRLLGVGITGLTPEPVRQMELFEAAPGATQRATDLARVTDSIRAKLGDEAITRARLLARPTEQQRRDRLDR